MDRKLAWVNSICALVLLIGIFGAREGSKLDWLPSVLENPVPAILEPSPPPPQPSADPTKRETDVQDNLDPPQAVVVTPDAPNIVFSVPTIGNVVAPAALANPPPLNPLRPPAPLPSVPVNLNTTGLGGERPQPPYPKIALDQRQQGRVTLLLMADDKGSIVTVEIKESSGFPVLDRGAVEYVKKHWTLPQNPNSRLFETTINYRIEMNR